MKINKIKLNLVILTLILIISLRIVLATPTAVTNIINVSSSGKTNPSTGYQVNAFAGNITKIIINDTYQTKRWQGYVGNISGQILLEDSDNFSLYNWELTSPQGEIYASNGSTVTWADIKCFNFTSNQSGDGWTMNLTTLEDMVNTDPTDRDGVDETFNLTYSSNFNVGSVSVGNGCRQTYLNKNGSYQTTDFIEVILTDNVSVIWTSLLEQDMNGYDTNSWDFQMLVGDDGDNSVATNYYFFVELE